MRETYAKTVKSSDVVGFAEITGDRNPIHLSEHFAAKTPFKNRIAHGLYTASLISAVIGTRLPGPGAIYISQTLELPEPGEDRRHRRGHCRDHRTDRRAPARSLVMRMHGRRCDGSQRRGLGQGPAPRGSGTRNEVMKLFRRTISTPNCSAPRRAVYSGSGDLGEVLATAQRIKPGDPASWFDCWSDLAKTRRGDGNGPSRAQSPRERRRSLAQGIRILAPVFLLSCATTSTMRAFNRPGAPIAPHFAHACRFSTIRRPPVRSRSAAARMTCLSHAARRPGEAARDDHPSG